MTKTRTDELADLVTRAKHAYYNTDQPIMSDDEYDAIEDALKEFDPTNAALTIGAAPVSEWKKATHDIPMGSLGKRKTPELFREWVRERSDKCKSGLFYSDKLDGISIEVKYERGKAIQAITRGDGATGEDITVNVLKMHGVKAILPVPISGSLRGEIILLRRNHGTHFSAYKNPRNAASGIAKRYDGLGCEFIDVYFYDAIIDGRDFEFESDKMAFIKDVLGLQTPSHGIMTGADAVNQVVTLWQMYQITTRDSLAYDIDGLVVRINHIPTQVSLGETNLIPKGAIAFKFTSEEAITIIREIEQSVGNTGVITPVAIFDPVKLMGATVTRASLYNYGYIKELCLDVGAEVTVLRANDVIPRVESVEKYTGTIAQAPSKCPVCGAPTEDRGAFLVCTDTLMCPAQAAGRIKNWVNHLNLLDFGVGLIDKLVESGKVKTVADLYRLKEGDISTIDRMGVRSAKKVIDVLNGNKKISLEKFLGSLSIPMIGERMFTHVVEAGYDTLDKIYALSASQLSHINKVGPVKADKLFDGLIKNKALVAELLSLGITIKSKEGCLKGKSFLFTGTMKSGRKQLIQMVEDNGGTIKSGSSLNYLVINDPNFTSAKAVAAKKYGTKCITEDEFLAMIKKEQ